MHVDLILHRLICIRQRHGHSRLLTEKLLPSFKVIDKVGEVAGESIEIAARGGEFLSKDDLRQRAKVGQTVIEKLSDLGLLQGMADSNQLSLFDL